MQQNSGEQPVKNQVYSREEYAKASFWDDRYAEKGGFFDWYAEYPELKPAFEEYNITHSDKILMVGCGNSKLSQQMWEAGYKDIINIDISPSVIQQMKTKYPHMIWEVMDATNMTYPDGHFDVVIDKGTLDALIAGKNFDICEAMLRDCMRVTNPEGQLIQITYGSPEGRRKIFEGALPFDQYDYYQCRAELNDMSTMINLMRSNIPGKNLKNIIREQDAMLKTLKQFSMIKLMRRKRKNQKEFIIWNHHEQQKLEINTGHLQPVKKEEASEEKMEEEKVEVKVEEKMEEERIQANVQEKVEKIEQQKVEKIVEQQLAAEPKAAQVPAKVEPKPKAEQPFTYAPKKQPYVYVYSIRRKFAQGFDDYMADFSDDQLLKKYLNKETNQCRFEGNPQQQNFTIFTQLDNYINVLRALRFLELKGASTSSLLLTSDPNKALNNSQKLILFRSYSTRKHLVLRKTNVDVTIKLTNKFGLEWAFKELAQLSRRLVTSADLYPCPKTFALFHVLKNRRLGGITANQIMEKYWFPTYKIRSATSTEIELQLSLPPVTDKKQSQILEAIQALLKPATVSFDYLKRGYLSYFDLNIWSIINMACLSYAGEKLDLVLQDFWGKDELNSNLSDYVFDQNSLYNELPNTIALPEPITSQALAHLLALY